MHLLSVTAIRLLTVVYWQSHIMPAILTKETKTLKEAINVIYLGI